MKSVRIATIGSPGDYRQSLFPIIAQGVGYSVEWTAPKQCDLLVYGPFANPNPKKMGWCPKPLRPWAEPLQQALLDTVGRQNQPLRLSHTAENIRHDTHSADYAISFDLAISPERHFRLPYWMEMIDWSHEGIRGNTNPRYGPLLRIERLMQPLGNRFLSKPFAAAFLSSHLREPRKTLFEAVNKALPVTGFGAYFDKSIKNHYLSGFLKHSLLQDFAFNLCPENGMYPGYYTEKVPEAFFADCLPIAWADDNIQVDFNPNAFINLAPMTKTDFESLGEVIQSPHALDHYAAQALLLKKPSILPFMEFVKRVLDEACS
jgi:hypothetical protein